LEIIMPRFVAAAILAVLLVLAMSPAAFADPDETVRSSDQVLHEVMSIPASSIPERLLAEAQGVAIIPDVIKIGFIAGVRRGHGVVMVRDPGGQWTLPQFITLTGGSVGWQAGVQGTDVILVFMTRKSVDGLLQGKFTIGADAAAAAGPVGRNASAATDFRLKAEILSYSRSRGLFAGLAIDGSAIEIDGAAQSAYYGTGPGQPPARIPESASQLLQDLTNMTPSALVPAVPTEAPAPGVPTAAQPLSAVAPAVATTAPTPASAPDSLNALRESLAKKSIDLQAIVNESWQRYLALPREAFDGTLTPSLQSYQRTLQQYDRVAQAAQYQGLTSRPEFRATLESLRAYTKALESNAPAGADLSLPPPPNR
jgi:lipid-binding SYLF domain-containing protein